NKSVFLQLEGESKTPENDIMKCKPLKIKDGFFFFSIHAETPIINTSTTETAKSQTNFTVTVRSGDNRLNLKGVTIEKIDEIIKGIFFNLNN
ncbi:MAG: hypothetical protein H0X29_11445, partial [Parachlamydiaceae bacterium]|nr:hypothetical protein [Parachlamydiaceae bacterium]